jgi:hypothetical protein
MDWLLLIVVVPVVVAIVLLFRFAGCAKVINLEDVQYNASPPTTQPVRPDPPFNLRVTDVGEAHITLIWDHRNPGSLVFEIERDGRTVHTTPNNVMTWTDRGLAPGQMHTYRVRAKNETTGLFSDYSNAVSPRTLQWVTIFSQQMNQSEANLAGHCLVQPITPNLYQRFNGTVRQTRLVLRGATSASPTIIDRVSVSHAATPGVSVPGNPNPQAWDSLESSPVDLGRVNLPADGSPVAIGPVPFALNPTMNLLVAFDISPQNTTGAFGLARSDSATAVSRAGSNPPGQAMVANRETIYNNRPLAGIYFVERIEVLAG